MSLVAYGSGSSDESENEEEETSTTNNLQNANINRSNFVSSGATQKSGINLPSPKNALNLESLPSGHNVDGSSSLFSTLPLPKKMLAEDLGRDLGLIANESIFPGTTKKMVKITVPPLAQFKEGSDEPLEKKMKPTPKGSGLFSLLPAPKNVIVKETKRPLVPHVLTKKHPAPTIKINSTPSVISKPSVELISYADSGEDSDNSDGLPDFFSLTSGDQESKQPVELSATNFVNESAPENSFPEANENPDAVEQPLAFASGFRPTSWASNQPSQPGPSWQNTADQTMALDEPFGTDDYLAVVEEEDLKLDDEALERLCGRRAKKQRKPLEFIDVKGAELLPDPKEWLIKQLSEEQPKMRSHSHKKNDGPTTQQRRKHQITYLAFQAKESELELKNQWAQNRMSRKQTQSKYGF